LFAVTAFYEELRKLGQYSD